MVWTVPDKAFRMLLNAITGRGVKHLNKETEFHADLKKLSGV